MSTSFLQDDLGYIPAATPVSPNMTGISTPPTSSADDIVFPPYQTLQRKRQLSSTNPDSLNPLSPKRIRQDPIPTPLSSYGESQISINLSGITDLLVSLDNRCREEFQALRDLRKEITEIKEKVTRTETSIAFIVNQNDHIQGVLSRLIPSHPNSERESPVIGQARDLVELIDDLEVDCGVNGEGDSDEVDEVVKRGCDRESTGFSYDPAIDSFIVQEPSEFVDEDSNGEVVMVERGESDIEINVRSEEPRNSSPPGATPSNETETTKEVNDITDNIGEQGTSEQHRNSDVDDIHLAGGIMESENTPKALSSLNTSEAEPERDLTTAMSEDESNPNSMESAGVQNGSDVKVVEQVNHESSQQNLTNDGVLEVETDERLVNPFCISIATNPHPARHYPQLLPYHRQQRIPQNMRLHLQTRRTPPSQMIHPLYQGHNRNRTASRQDRRSMDKAPSAGNLIVSILLRNRNEGIQNSCHCLFGLMGF